MRDSFLKYITANISIIQNFMWFDAVETEGHETNISRSIASDNISSYERHSYKSKFISVSSQDYHYWTNQFSYYIHLTYQKTISTGYSRVSNTSTMDMINTNQSIIHKSYCNINYYIIYIYIYIYIYTIIFLEYIDIYVLSYLSGTIHYISGYSVDFTHGIMLLSVMLHTFTNPYLVSQSYVTIARDVNCNQNIEGEFLISFNQRSVNKGTSSISLIENIIRFHGPCLYFMVMLRNFLIDFVQFPHCEIVLSYRMVLRKITRRRNGTCPGKFYQVNSKQIID